MPTDAPAAGVWTSCVALRACRTGSVGGGLIDLNPSFGGSFRKTFRPGLNDEGGSRSAMETEPCELSGERTLRGGEAMGMFPLSYVGVSGILASDAFRGGLSGTAGNRKLGGGPRGLFATGGFSRMNG
jgi:hypothetical protein